MVSPIFTLIRSDDAHASRLQDNIARVLTPLATAVGNTPIMGAAPPAWVRPSLANGLVPIAGFAAPAFHRDCLGYVHCGGIALSPGALGVNSVVFVFPPGYRPKAKRIFAVQGSGASPQFVQLDETGVLKALLAIAAGGNLTMEFTFLAEQ